jgi:hypothetical protein
MRTNGHWMGCLQIHVRVPPTIERKAINITVCWALDGLCRLKHFAQSIPQNQFREISSNHHSSASGLVLAVAQPLSLTHTGYTIAQMATNSSDAHRLDIAELERLKDLTERDSVKSLINSVIAKSQKLMERAQELERDQELKEKERQRLDEARKQREAELAAQGKAIPQPIGRSKVEQTCSFPHTVLCTC